MKKAILLFLVSAFISALTTRAQVRKELSLEDAVLKQYSDLRPRSLNGLMWIDDDTYSYIKGRGADAEMWSFDVKTDKEEVLWTPVKLQKAINAEKELKGLPHFEKIGTNLFAFSNDGMYYLWNARNNKVTPYHNETEGISDVHFSASGKYMAYVKNNNVYVKEGSKDAVQVTEDGSDDIVYGKAVSRFEFGISQGIFWHPDNDDALAFYRNDQTDVTYYPLVDLTTLPASPKPIKYPMAGGKSEKVSVRIYHPSTGKSTDLMSDPETHTYLCTVNWTPDASKVYLVSLNRDQNDMNILSFDATNGKLLGSLYEEMDEKYVEPLYPLIFLDDAGKDFMYFSQKGGFMHAYRMKGGKEEQVTTGKFPITRYIGSNEEKTIFLFEATGEVATENHIFRLDLTGGNFDRISRNSGTYHSDISDKGSYLITQFSSLEVPGKTVIADDKGIVLKQLLVSGNPLEEYQVRPPELLTVTNRQGIELHARMVKPSNFEAGVKYPVLVYLYNGPHVQLVRNTWWAATPLWMNYLAEQGYIVFSIDGRGSYNRGKNFEQAVFRQLSKLEMEDQVDGVNFLKGLDFIDTNHFAVHGWSFGGFMTTSLMLKYPGVFNVGVAGGPVTNWAYYEVMYTERYMDDPKTNPEGFKETDLTNFAKNLRGKLLLIHGLSDDVVVPQHNFTLIRKFVDEGVQVDFFPYPGHPHNVRGKDRLHLMRKVIDYIMQYNQP